MRQPRSESVRDMRVPQGGMSGRAIREFWLQILREFGKPMHTRELYGQLQERGIRFGGASPIASLSGYLSRSPDFMADRSSGWSLREWEKISRR